MASSQARIEANRRNAALSSGPKSPEGKAASRKNALKDGLTGKGVVLPPELEPQLATRTAEWSVELQPGSEPERQMVEQMAWAQMQMQELRQREGNLVESNRRRDLALWDEQRTVAATTIAQNL